MALAGMQLTKVLLLWVEPVDEILVGRVVLDKVGFRIALFLDRVGTDFLLLVAILRALRLACMRSYHLWVAGTRIRAFLAAQIIQTLACRYVVVRIHLNY